MFLRKLATALRVASVAALIPGLVQAEGESAAERVAREKFNDGRALLAQGRWSEAAERFSQSQKLDPAPGTLANLAFCYEKLGNTSGAWIAYKETARAARSIGKSQWATLAEQSAAALEQAAPRVVILFERPEIDGLGLWLDGTELPQSLWRESPPVAPGRHELRATALGRRRWSTGFEVGSEGSATVRVPALESTTAPSPAVSPAPSQAVSRSRSTRPPTHTLAARRTAGVVLGSLGVAGLLTGSALAAVGYATYTRSTRYCLGASCSSQGASLRSTAIAESNAASVTLAVGGAATAGGLVLWFAATRNTSNRATGLAPATLDVGLGGTW